MHNNLDGNRASGAGTPGPKSVQSNTNLTDLWRGAQCADRIRDFSKSIDDGNTSHEELPSSVASIDKERKQLYSAVSAPDAPADHGIALLRLIASQVGEPRRGVEVGVSQGDTSRKLLLYFPDLQLYMVDSWATFPRSHDTEDPETDTGAMTKHRRTNHAAPRAADATLFAGFRRQLLKMDSVAAAELVTGESMDFVFIDADYTYLVSARD